MHLLRSISIVDVVGVLVFGYLLGLSFWLTPRKRRLPLASFGILASTFIMTTGHYLANCVRTIQSAWERDIMAATQSKIHVWSEASVWSRYCYVFGSIILIVSVFGIASTFLPGRRHSRKRIPAPSSHLGLDNQ